MAIVLSISFFHGCSVSSFPIGENPRFGKKEGYIGLSFFGIAFEVLCI